MSRIDKIAESYKPGVRASALCGFHFTDQLNLNQLFQLSGVLADICRSNQGCTGCISERVGGLGGITQFIDQEIGSHVPYR